MLTTTVKQGGGTDYSLGFHTVKIASAIKDSYNESPYYQLTFEGYPENFNLRIYEVTDGENWRIAQLYRFANAGITGALEDSGGGEIIIKIDDNPNHLIGKELNVFFYKDGDYTRPWNRIVPTVFENDAEKFTEADITYWKDKVSTAFEEAKAKKEKSSDMDGLPI